MPDLRIAVVQHEPATSLGAFGDLLARAAVELELVRSWRDALPEPDELDGVIVLGGSMTASDTLLAHERRWIGLLAERVPYLGICLGAQLLAAALGAAVFRGPRPEIGMHDVYLTDAARRDPLFTGLPGRLRVFQWHADTFALPSGAVPLAGSIGYRYQAFRSGALAYGVQFHPEATSQAVAGWPGTPGYLAQLETAGLDAQAVFSELEREEIALRRLAGRLLERWLGLCARVASPARAGRATGKAA
jgi:GMP synthase-like glutamine amidotransferase